jgi:hypothetical protein
MVNTRNVRNGAENSQGNGNPPPPPSLAQAIASKKLGVTAGKHEFSMGMPHLDKKLYI